MTSIGQKIKSLHEELPHGVTLVAVSKFHPADCIRQAYEAGQRYFGESRIQELLDKQEQLPEDIKWHFIGHLQTNKVRKLIGRAALIESVDSERLLQLIDSESQRAGVTTRILMQVHVAAEETKFGFSPDELLDYFRERKFESLTNVHICGIMGMASNTDDKDRVRADFKTIAGLHHEIVTNVAPDLRDFDVISMGMSGDWPIAVEEGANMVRIGSAIFGERNY